MDQQDLIRKGILGTQLYKLCKEKKATDEHLEDRALLLSNSIGKSCTKDDIINLCGLSSTNGLISSKCSDNYENPLLIKLNELLEGQVECPICYDELDETARIAGKCGHIFHENCLNNLIEKNIQKCPICRQPITYKKQISTENKCKEMFENLDSDSYTKQAAKENSLDCLKWALKKGSSCSIETTAYAAKVDNVEIMRYAHEHGCPWHEETCSVAALVGSLDCLRYAHENGCEWDEETCNNAAKNGHLDCLKYAHENGCPWEYYTLVMAGLHGHFDTFKYAVDNGCPVNPDVLISLEHIIKKLSILPDEAAVRKQCLDYLKSKGWKKGFFSRKWSLN